MRIGIFGGCFNPPHKMHYNIASGLIKKGYLDRIVFVPTGNFYNKKDLITSSKRLDMINIMIKSDSNLSVSDYEFGELTYTYQTLQYFKEIYPNDDIYFICGSDNLSELETWKNYEWILANFKLLVMNRNGDDLEKIINKYSKYRENIIISDLDEEVISSTMIRSNIKDGINTIDKYLDKDVYLYILDNNLYR